MPTDSQTVRDYVRGWVDYHSSDEADVQALTDQVISEGIREPSKPLTDSVRQELDEKLGTKDGPDATTPAAVAQEEMQKHIDDHCAERLAEPVATLVLNEKDVGWGWKPTDAIPHYLAESFRLLVQKGLTEDTIQRLQEDFCADLRAQGDEDDQ